MAKSELFLTQTFGLTKTRGFKNTLLFTVVSLIAFMNTTHAVILSDSTTRRVQSKVQSSHQQTNSSEKLADLIKQKSKEYKKNTDAFYRSQQNNSSNYSHYPYDGHDHSSAGFANWQVSSSYKSWISNSYNKQRANEYKKFLQKRVGKNNVPKLPQLLQTARSWQRCGAEQFEIPPKYLWGNMVSTLFLLSELKKQGIVPKNITIRSVYRNPSLNRCAGGADGSKHKINAAMDLWTPRFDSDINYRYNIQDRLCNFWMSQGHMYNFGLGIYSSGAIHIDTDGYRKWGSNFSAKSSPCRS